MENSLILLKQGAKVWNRWRKENLYADIHLNYANLSDADLRGFDLTWTNLNYANLSDADLSDANLSGADLSNADLSGADINGANLSGVNLSGVNLSGAVLSGAVLSGVNLSGAVLSGFDLSNADLSDADLSNADLSNADLSGAVLINTNLFAAKVLHTNFREAIFTGACIQDWQLGSSTTLEGVECDYIFRTVDSRGKFAGRCPANSEKIFELGEFAKLFQVSQNTVELIFQKGLKWEAFAYSFNETNTKVFNDSGEKLYLRKYEVLEDGLIRLEVTVPFGSDKQVIHDYLERGYEQQIARLEGEVKAKNEVLNQILRMLKPGDIYMNNSNNVINQTVNGPVGNMVGKNYGTMTATINQNQEAISQLITALRVSAQSFPSEQKEEVLMELDDLEVDLKEPKKQEPKRIGRRLQRLIAAGTAAATIAGGAATFSGNVNEFTQNVLELGEKVGLSKADVQGNQTNP